MSSPVKVGRETTHGTLAGALFSCPVSFDAKLDQKNTIPDEQRNAQDTAFAMLPGVRAQSWSVKDSYVYHDNFGLWLDSAMGLPVSTLSETGVYDSVYKFLDDPCSLSLQWGQPRRQVQGYQSLYAVVDKLSLKFAADGDLKFDASGAAMPESEITAPVHSFTTVVPFTAWEGAVTLGGGAYASLVSGTVSIARNRKPFRAINNTQAPASMSIGNRAVDFDLVLDFAAKTDYDRFKAATTDALTIVWVDGDVLIGATNRPTLTVKLGTIGYETAEIDTGGDLPSLKVKGSAIYNSTDASQAVVTLRSTRQYQTL